MRSTFYSQNYVCWPPVLVSSYANPNSGYWQEQAMTAGQNLRDAMDDEAWFTWCDSFNADAPGDKTWREIHDIYTQALEKLVGENRDKSPLSSPEGTK